MNMIGGLHLHSAALESWLTKPPEYEGPLESVAFPRERKPSKRDRHELRRIAAVASRRRGPWITNERGWDHNLDHAVRFEEFNLARHYRYRLRVLRDLFSAHETAEHKRYWRAALAEAAMCNRPRLP